ncbi:hypothetical protein, partial [Pseudomonas sp. FW305-BF6]|uniref:hypothetical protein n=1 Tax=Pseudomonas sp. FW305-BF6 TaxID=2070673 RepID=UPI001C481121
MKQLWLFLKFEKSYLYMFIISNIVLGALFYTDPTISLRWQTFIYATTLNLLILTGFLLYRFQKNIHIVRRIDEGDHENVSFEGFFYQQHLEELKKNQIRTINEIQY